VWLEWVCLYCGESGDGDYSWQRSLRLLQLQIFLNTQSRVQVYNSVRVTMVNCRVSHVAANLLLYLRLGLPSRVRESTCAQSNWWTYLQSELSRVPIEAGRESHTAMSCSLNWPIRAVPTSHVNVTTHRPEKLILPRELSKLKLINEKAFAYISGSAIETTLCAAV